MAVQLKYLPQDARDSLEKLEAPGKPIYFARYADGCMNCKTSTGWQHWEGYHAPHNQFVKDEPVEVWRL